MFRLVSKFPHFKFAAICLLGISSGASLAKQPSENIITGPVEATPAPAQTKPQTQPSPSLQDSESKENFSFEPDHLVVFIKSESPSLKKTILHECRVAFDSPELQNLVSSQKLVLSDLIEEARSESSAWMPRGRGGFREDLKVTTMVNLTLLSKRLSYSLQKSNQEEGEFVREGKAAKLLEQIAQQLCR